MTSSASSRYYGSDRMLRHGLLFLALYSSLWAFMWVREEQYLEALVAAFFGTFFIVGWALAFAADQWGVPDHAE